MALLGRATARAGKAMKRRWGHSPCSGGMYSGWNQRSTRANRYIRAMPMTKLGTDMVSWVSTVTARSATPPGRRAARSPRGSEMSRIRAKAMAARVRVAPTLGAMSWATVMSYL